VTQRHRRVGGVRGRGDRDALLSHAICAGDARRCHVERNSVPSADIPLACRTKERTMSSQKAEYDEQGYIFRPGLLSADEVKTITDELDGILAGGPRPGLVLEKDGVTPRSVFNPQLYSDVFDRVMRHPKVLNTSAEPAGDQL